MADSSSGKRKNVVAGENYRITVLTPKLLRMEYAENGCFADLASQTVFFRDFPAGEFISGIEDGVLTVETEALRLRYAVEKPFGEDSLNIQLKIEPASSWNFGEDFEDLGGTACTLDRVDGRFPVDRGVCSRNGFSVIDDSESLLIGDNFQIVVRPENAMDVYFFGYGFSYLEAVQDLYRLTGAPSMLPAYALGNWWSRYYAYTQQEYLNLMDRFREEDVPFSVGVVDMDWHITKIPDELKVSEANHSLYGSGWTGYTWNKELFLDYKQFLRDLHDRNLKTALNLHPAVGTRCHEEMYEEMAKANGIDPATKQRVPLDILSKKHMASYFDILHHPYEKDGVDFWWMDWQQGTDYWWIHEKNAPGEYKDPRERMDPLWLLNHLHILDISRDGNKRPMFFSRYSGPGSHRYPVGFSGDTFVSWDSLKFQPEFTATASNIGYSWWSHDIGGHNLGVADNELYIRWVQLGVFSPINRLHSTKDRFMFKETFQFREEVKNIASHWLRLRHSLFPYLYTMNYRNHHDLQPLVQPMYYSHPKCNAAYRVPNQFWFGSELVVSPITQKNDPASCLGQADVWLPKGDWFDFFNGLHYHSNRGREIEVFRSLDGMPVFAKAGAIVPMANYAKHDNRLSNAEDMSILVFPGQSNSFVLYEDAGEGDAYKNGAFTTTVMELQWGKEAVFTIRPAQGNLSLIPHRRTWRIGLRGFHKDVKICVSVNGMFVTAQCNRDSKCNTHYVAVEANAADSVMVTVEGEQLVWDNSDVMDRCEKLIASAQIPFCQKTQLWERVNWDKDLWSKRLSMVGVICGGDTAKAVVELLSLTEDPYEGKRAY